MIGIDQYILIMLMASIAAGLIGSLVGIGGGILIVPILNLGFGVPLEYAIGASIISVIATSSGAASAYVKDKITNLRIGMFLETATTTGAILGAVSTIYLLHAGLTWIVYVVFGLVLVLSSADLIRRSRDHRIHLSGEPSEQRSFAEKLKLNGAYYDHVLNENVMYKASNVFGGLVVLFCAGVISGLLGIGSGSLKVLGMDSLMKLPFKVSTTTSNFMIGVTAAASTGIFYIGGFVNPVIAAPVAIGVVLGSYIGTKVLLRSKPSSLRLLFIVVLLILGVEMIQRGVLHF